MGVSQLIQVQELLDRQKIQYQLLEHAPVYTSKQAAKIRGVKLKTGVKALVLKTKSENFVLALVAADRKINLQILAKIVGTKRLSLASPEEVLMITGCKVGAVHPFGNLFGLSTFFDQSILKNKTVNFNAGLHTVSLRMKAKDLFSVIKPVSGEFSQLASDSPEITNRCEHCNTRMSTAKASTKTSKL